MKNIFFVSLGISLFFVNICLSVNLIQNGGFENGITGWDTFQYSSGWRINTATPHSGSKALEFSFPTGTGYYDASMRVDGGVLMQANVPYQLSFWMKELDTHCTGGSQTTILDLSIYGNNGESYGWDNFGINQEWHQVIKTLTFSSDTTADITFQLHGFTTSSNASFMIDDVVLIPEPATILLLSLGGLTLRLRSGQVLQKFRR